MRLAWLAGAFVLVAAAAAVARATPAGGESLSRCDSGRSQNFELRSTLAFSSTRDNPTGAGLATLADAAEIYLMSPDGTDLRRLTDNSAVDDFPALSPDGKTIVFDSGRLSGQVNDDDLFLMNADGSDQQFLTRGASATWSPDCKEIAFAASASGRGTPIRDDPGSATTDSDIFVANVEDLLAGETPRNLTNSPDLIDDDADWSPDGQHIVYTAHLVTDDRRLSNTAELYVIDPGGHDRVQLTANNYEERAPSWSPDGTKIVYSCRTGGNATVFHVCVINADGTGFARLTDDSFGDLTASWSPDGQQILYHKNKALGLGGPQLWVMKADGTDQRQLTAP
jgi:TolB protein